jgi:predicted Ser/Thr protein kinase
MCQLLVCPRGHQWEAPAAAVATLTLSSLPCPVCGDAAASASPADTAVSGTRQLDDLPPPPQPLPAAATAARSGYPQVPGFEILGELGRGGMGVVYRARQINLNRLVALKMILAGAYAGEQDRARFRAEAEAVAQLQHPNVVQIHEVGEAAGHPFFALELVDGGSLDRQLQGTPQPPRQAAQLVATLARAMHYAHRHGIVHRDLKPANVLLTADGTPKITDFGLAKRLDNPAGQTASGAILGTPSYMAPEQAAGKSRQIGPPADVYALGAILYECLTGRAPFRAATPLDTLLLVVSTDPVPLSRLQPGMPRDLETICLGCLRKEPGQRYASALALADDLERFVKDEPIRARRVTLVEWVWRWGRHHRLVAGLGGAVVVLLLGWLGLALWSYRADRLGSEELLPVVAELNRLEPGWHLENIEAAREARRQALPPEQNAARCVEAAQRLLPVGWPGPEIERLQETLAGVGPLPPLDDRQRTALAAAWTAAAPALTEARKLAELPQGSFAFSWTRDGLSTRMPHLEKIQAVRRVLALDATLQAEGADADAALASCRGLLNTGRSLGDEPAAISQLVRFSLVARAITAVERVLAHQEPSEKALAATQELLADEAAQPVLLIMARGERGMEHWLMSACEAGDFDIPQMLGVLGVEKEQLSRLPRGVSVRPAHVWLLRHLTQFVAIAQLPAHEQPPQIEPWQKAVKDAPAVAHLMLVDGPKLVQAWQLDQARLRGAVAAVAAERFRRAHGRWPEALAELTPLLLPEVPLDPFDGAPLRYRRVDDGVVVYSVGTDRQDNNGTLDRPNALRNGADVGFRLWDASRRRQAP